jgi:hypothetical protein
VVPRGSGPTGTSRGGSHAGTSYVINSQGAPRPAHLDTRPSLSHYVASMASLRRNPSRAARSAQPVVEEVCWIPELGSPRYTDADRRLDSLNQEAFPSKMFCQADNLLMYALFAGKGKKRRYNKLTPQQAQGSEAQGSEGPASEPSPPPPPPPPPMSPDEGRQAAAICKDLMDLNTPEASWDSVGRAVSRLQEEVPSFQSGERRWSACLQQCVILSYLLSPCL